MIENRGISNLLTADPIRSNLGLNTPIFPTPRGRMADPLSNSSVSEHQLLTTLKKVITDNSLTGDLEDKERRSERRFPTGHFFNEWFRGRGLVYSFLFKKNHRVTNIQVAELMALIRSYRSDGGMDVSFSSADDYKQSLMHIADSFRENINDFNCDALASRYSSLFANSAVVDIMYGSCVVFLPPGVAINLKAVCSRSGYIHSCGRNVYTRNIYKATKDELFGNIRHFLRTQPGKILFRPYSHEDFTEHDRSSADELSSGLDDVKISVQKSFLQECRLADVIEEMRTTFSDSLAIPYPGDYREDKTFIDKCRKKGGFDSAHALFMIMDHSLDESSPNRGNRHFIICFDQEWINENPYHLFDENKPAWFDHTTLPHTLAGAMISITRPGWPEKKTPITICDCFVGSGTMMLEAIKFDGIACNGVDYEPISRLLLEDNGHYFSLSAAELLHMTSELSKVAIHLKNPDLAGALKVAWEDSEAAIAWGESAIAFAEWEDRSQAGPESTSTLIDKLGSGYKGRLARLLFYTRLKAYRRNEAALRSRSVTETHTWLKELTALQISFDQLVALRQRTETGVTRGHFCEYQGVYSNGISVSLPLIASLSDAVHMIDVRDCRTWEPDQLFDVIVTDPPYGFNTDEKPELLADVYTSFLTTAIRSLAEDGQLVLALPDWSHTGRQLPAFILKDFVIHQVLSIAQESRREVIHSVLQSPRTVGSPPYYWESARALKRAILHFRFRAHASYRRNTGIVAEA